MRLKFIFLFLLLFSVEAGAAVEGQEVVYRAGETEMKGYLAYDNSVQGKRPGVLVVHEWWGHDDYARKRARMLAGLGYTALAVDMYGDGKKAEHPSEASQFAQAVSGNMDLAKARFEAALEFLKNHETADPEKIAAIGYCFGGGIVLNMARMGADLKGVASFHGSLATKTPAQKGGVKAKVLVLNGADDKFVSEEDTQAFKKEMEGAGVDYRFIAYPGAKHGFTNPDADKLAKEFEMNIAYNAEADQKSWQELQRFFTGLLDE